MSGHLVPRPGEVVVTVPALAVSWLHGLAAEREREIRSNGTSLRPEYREALEVLRLAALDALAMSAGPQRTDIPRSGADLAAESGHVVMRTSELAKELGKITPRHARRLAARAGVQPIGRDRWPADAPARIRAA